MVRWSIRSRMRLLDDATLKELKRALHHSEDDHHNEALGITIHYYTPYIPKVYNLLLLAM